MGCAEHDKLKSRYQRASLEHTVAASEFRRNTCIGVSELLKQAVCETRLNAEIAFGALVAHERTHQCTGRTANSLT